VSEGDKNIPAEQRDRQMWRQELTLAYCVSLGGRIGCALCRTVSFGLHLASTRLLLMFNYAASKATHTHIALLTPTNIISCLPSRWYTHKHAHKDT